jgi:hypothetical protein
MDKDSLGPLRLSGALSTEWVKAKVRSDAVEFEAGLLEERAVLGLGALLAFGQCEHADVEYIAGVKGVAFGPDPLDDEQPAAGGHGTMAVGEDDARFSG